MKITQSPRQVIKKLSDEMAFGKYKDTGLTIEEILSEDAQYLLWLAKEEIVLLPDVVIAEAERLSNKQPREWRYNRYDDTGVDDDWGDRNR